MLPTATCVTAQAVILSNLIMGKINGHDQKQNERVLLSAGRTSRAMPFDVMREDKMRPTMCMMRARRGCELLKPWVGTSTNEKQQRDTSIMFCLSAGLGRRACGFP